MAATLPGAVPTTSENPHTLLNPFLHNLNDDINNVSTENILDILMTARHRRYAIAAIIIFQGISYP